MYICANPDSRTERADQRIDIPTMELGDLDNLNKNDFLPLLSQNIKQELFDPGQDESICEKPQEVRFSDLHIVHQCQCETIKKDQVAIPLEA